MRTLVTTNGLAVNGTGMIRPGSAAGAVGGPAKAVAGAISGSRFQPKHPEFPMARRPGEPQARVYSGRIRCNNTIYVLHTTVGGRIL